MLLDYLIDQNNVDTISREDVRLVQSLIQGQVPASLDHEKRWMYEIIANKKNSLDVDKIDYLQRDAKQLGLCGIGFVQDRILNNARVINNEVCYHNKIYYDIEKVFMTRYQLHKDCYSHRVARAIDFMVVDALLEANPVFHFEEKIRDAA